MGSLVALRLPEVGCAEFLGGNLLVVLEAKEEGERNELTGSARANAAWTRTPRGGCTTNPASTGANMRTIVHIVKVALRDLDLCRLVLVSRRLLDRRAVAHCAGTVAKIHFKDLRPRRSCVLSN